MFSRDIFLKQVDFCVVETSTALFLMQIDRLYLVILHCYFPNADGPSV